MTIQEIEFDNMVGLIVSFDQEGYDDADLKDIFKTVRETCPSAFDKLLLIAAALKDPRFESAGVADAARILKAFETTSNFKADLDRFLGIMLDVDYLAEFQARVATGDYFAKAAKKFVDEYGESAQVYAEVEECLAV